MRTPIHYHYHRPGKPVTVYNEWLVQDRPDAKVLLLEAYAGKAVDIAGHRVLDPGAPIVWYVFPDAWHDVGRFHLADGTFTGWYTNLAMPVTFQDLANWACTDLFLDLWTPVTGSSVWLDEDEFAQAVARGLIEPEVAARATEERHRIARCVAAAGWPPTVARELDLQRARSLMGSVPPT